MATDLTQYDNRTGRIMLDTLAFRVRIVRARTRYGHLDFLVTPLDGEGERWVEQHKVTLDEALTTTTVEISDTLVHEIKTPQPYNVRVDSF